MKELLFLFALLAFPPLIILVIMFPRVFNDLLGYEGEL